jgi:hypothetical protein
MEKNQEREALLGMLQKVQEQVPAVTLSSETRDSYLEEPIRETIAKGGRVNAVDLLHTAALIVRGELPPSPALADWLDQGIQRIFAGEKADVAFGTGRKPGRHDPLASRDKPLAIKAAVDEARAKGFMTQASPARPSCFEEVADEAGCEESQVRKPYYTWETLENIEFPRPPDWPIHLPWPPTHS